MERDPFEQLTRELRRQHQVWARSGYDGHNRHSGLTTMHRLNLRRSRRVWRQRLCGWCAGYDFGGQDGGTQPAAIAGWAA